MLLDVRHCVKQSALKFVITLVFYNLYVCICVAGEVWGSYHGSRAGIGSFCTIILSSKVLLDRKKEKLVLKGIIRQS